MDNKKLVMICLVIGVIAAGSIAPSTVAAHDNGKNHSRVQVTCSSGGLDTPIHGTSTVGTQVVLNCSGCEAACSEKEAVIGQKKSDSSAWDTDPFFDKYSF